MPGVLTKYHRHFLPKGGTFSREMGAVRKNQAHRIKTLRNQVGRKEARKTLITAAKTHVAGAKEAARQSAVSKFREKHQPEVSKSPRWRKRGGGKVTVRRLAALPRKLIKKV